MVMFEAAGFIVILDVVSFPVFLTFLDIILSPVRIENRRRVRWSWPGLAWLGGHLHTQIGTYTVLLARLILDGI